jgi:hypothetical protein
MDLPGPVPAGSIVSLEVDRPTFPRVTIVELTREYSFPDNWLESIEQSKAMTVGSLVGGTFEAYVRILHPAGLGNRPVTWAEVAIAQGVDFDAGTSSWYEVSGSSIYAEPQGKSSDSWETPPQDGLPHELAEAIAGVLGVAGSMHASLYAYVEHHGDFVFNMPGYSGDVVIRSTRYAIYPFAESLRWKPLLTPRANMWWSSGNWLSVSDYDLTSTYMGGSVPVVSSVLENPLLETALVTSATPIGEQFASGE